MPRDGRIVRARLQEAALDLFVERGYDETSAASIAERAGVTERTFFRHFADKREVFFDGDAELSDGLNWALEAVPSEVVPLEALRAAFHESVPLFEGNRPVTERRAPVILATPALRERQMSKVEGLVETLTAAFERRGVAARPAAFAARIGMDLLGIATARWFEDATRGLHAEIDEAFRELARVADSARVL
ncbi:TetR family transcriptional regulator [Frondihabitans sp. PAMC 28766]|uniref:TetR/AcrR family transcriptional regulator n=1 Tax=Frondihabitans sp. PAMC 28766 TaxID=1795630 RepID=UPI00078E68EC|nr:TetR/AcrR family transcriptional regulator [Frondihabitans sp. PAMC 28766]AMM18905.1 TetR family transcriptional regulator [Frondihabitans sp. PAMC 28766]